MVATACIWISASNSNNSSVHNVWLKLRHPPKWATLSHTSPEVWSVLASWANWAA